MRLLATLLLILALTATAVAQHNELTQEQIDAGWISLFDGETLFGWQQVNDVDWQVVDGEIRATSGDQGFLMTTAEFADYALYLEFKAPAETNSGVFLRTPLEPQDPAKDCYELNIAPTDNPYPTGSFVGRHRATLLPGEKLRAFGEPVTAWDGEWHSYGVRFIGGTISVQIDGREVSGMHEQNPIARGRIGLQHNSGEVAFRNVRLKPLRTKPIFNGKDLTGWNTKRAEVSEFKVTPEGELRVLNGRGQLESDASYGDFVLQLECFVDGDALNSGVFFRCIPGDFMMGYECQIHNGFNDDDRTNPVDCGTGGIFRRQNARRVVANDREWFAMTLVADGPHMAAWVNGQQVSDWTDERDPDENPRRGLRLEPGTLAIQGHDPTTDLRFRNLRIAEMPSGEE